jgi:hypothetical protein
MAKPKPFHHQIQCDVDAIYVDRVAHVARVDIPKHHAPDFSGCIAAIQAIDADVQMIDVFSNGNPDTRYALSRGEWRAFRIEWKSE